MTKVKTKSLGVAKLKFAHYARQLIAAGLVNKDGRVLKGELDGIKYRPSLLDRLITVHMANTGFCTQKLAGQVVGRSPTYVSEGVKKQERWVIRQAFHAANKAHVKHVETTMKILTQDPAVLAKRAIDAGLTTSSKGDLLLALRSVALHPMDWLVVLLVDANDIPVGVGIEFIRLKDRFDRMICVVDEDWDWVGHKVIEKSLNQDFDLKRRRVYEMQQAVLKGKAPRNVDFIPPGPAELKWILEPLRHQP